MNTAPEHRDVTEQPGISHEEKLEMLRGMERSVLEKHFLKELAKGNVQELRLIESEKGLGIKLEDVDPFCDSITDAMARLVTGGKLLEAKALGKFAEADMMNGYPKLQKGYLRAVENNDNDNIATFLDELLDRIFKVANKNNITEEYVMTLFIHEQYGGEVVCGKAPDGTMHYWNGLRGREYPNFDTPLENMTDKHMLDGVESLRLSDEYLDTRGTLLEKLQRS